MGLQTVWRQLALVVIVAALVSSGCGGTGGSTTTPTPAPTATPDLRRTGIVGVDVVIDAVVSGNVSALRSLIGYASVACTNAPGSYRPCPSGQAEGSPIEALRATQCEQFFIGADVVSSRLTDLMAPPRRVYAVYPKPGADPSATSYVIVLVATAGGRDWGSALTVEGGRLTSVDFGCRKTPEQIVQGAGLRDPVLPPVSGE